ncbi:MAG: DUF4349 domain-containing protein [Spirochaetia bacterium]|nr:DUF4349 domain-containing protein [Spirochaetia bacterium]
MRRILVVSALSLIFVLCNCSKRNEAGPSSASRGDSSPGYFGGRAEKAKGTPDGDEKKVADVEEKNASDKDASSTGLGKVFFSADPGSSQRLLEFSGELFYRSKDIQSARKFLLDWSAKYGFLAESHAYGGETPSLSSTIHLRSERLYEALSELDRLGILDSERFSTVDHTESMMLQTLRKKREEKRLSRRQAASSGLGASEKNWQAIESALAASEDQSDQAEFEKWKILDRVKWAKIRVDVSLPVPAEKIELPNYKKAFVRAANALLKLSYGLLIALPFLLLLASAAYGVYRLAKRLDSGSLKK